MRLEAVICGEIIIYFHYNHHTFKWFYNHSSLFISVLFSVSFASYHVFQIYSSRTIYSRRHTINSIHDLHALGRLAMLNSTDRCSNFMVNSCLSPYTLRCKWKAFVVYDSSLFERDAGTMVTNVTLRCLQQ